MGEGQMRRQSNLVLFGILGFALSLSPPFLKADGLPTEPILRLETGMHTGPIKRISVDQAGDLLITASDDKTLRLWTLDDGNPGKTLRIPIGEGEEGRLYAAALSPDGQWIAAGGATKAGTEGPGNYHLYLFDRVSGELRQHLLWFTQCHQPPLFFPGWPLPGGQPGWRRHPRLVHGWVAAGGQ
jgi:hypothetical protein